MPTFAELFCERYHVRPERFASAMFWRCLHRRAWPLVPILKLISPGYFLPDYDLVRDVGRLTRANDLTEDLADYHSHSRNVGFLRRKLRIRISVRRVTREVHRLLPGRANDNFYDVTKPPGEPEGNGGPLPNPPGHSASS